MKTDYQSAPAQYTPVTLTITPESRAEYEALATTVHFKARVEAYQESKGRRTTTVWRDLANLLERVRRAA